MSFAVQRGAGGKYCEDKPPIATAVGSYMR